MGAQQIVWLIVVSMTVALFNVLMSYKLIQHLQLSGYNVRAYYRKIKLRTLIEVAVCGAAACVLMIGSYFAVSAVRKSIGFLSAVPYIAVMSIFVFYYLVRTPKKTPLKFTNRIKRYYALYYIMTAAAAALTGWAGHYTPMGISLMSFTALLCYPLAGVAAAAQKPIERLFHNKYIYLAKSKLVRYKGLTVIGVTGSCGKTSVKFLLKKMLSEKYRVCATPGSYNTPMGVCRAVNEHLSREDEIFIVEMGARRKGDIEQICNIIRPNVSVITAVEPQHMETFKTIENIAATKYEIVEALNSGGWAAFNGDSANVIPLHDKCPRPKIITGERGEEHGISEKFFVTYSGVKVTESGSDFVLHLSDGVNVNCSTRLLGRHNISNITLAAGVAYKMGVEAHQLARAIAALEPVRHRLELIKTAQMTIIDDTFNANLKGALEAVEILKLFDKVKVVITAGLVEMGKAEYESHVELGKKIAVCADWCIMVGPNSSHIYDGLASAGMDINRIMLASSLDNAVKMLKVIEGEKAVLFQNDLPDNY